MILSSVLKFGLAKIDLTEDGIDDFVKLIPNYNNNIIIFDDLERCECYINEVLGFIEDFIEHSETFVIIISNKDEIGSWQLESNIELKTLLHGSACGGTVLSYGKRSMCMSACEVRVKQRKKD